MVGDLTSDELNLSFKKLVMFGSELGKMQSGGVITEWKDIPMELLLRIICLVDDRTVVMASGVCSGWRDAICLGLTHLSLSWYILASSMYFHVCSPFRMFD